LMMCAASQRQQQQADPGLQDPAKTFDDASFMFRWCHEAAKRFIFAQSSLGEIYREGGVVPKDKVTAYMWFLIAQRTIADVESRTQAALCELSVELTEKQIAEATRKASDWFKKHKPPQSNSSLQNSSLQEEVAKDSTAA
jgi:TPR repeat protein